MQRGFGAPSPYRRRPQDNSRYFTGGGSVKPRPHRWATETPARVRLDVKPEGSALFQSNRLTDIAPEGIKRFLEVPAPSRSNYRVALSFIRGQAGNPGASPPDTTRILGPLQSPQNRLQLYFNDASTFLTPPHPTVLEYDPAGGGAFFGTAPRQNNRQIADFSFLRPPQILVAEADVPLRKFFLQSLRPKDYFAEGNTFRVRHVPNLFTQPEELIKFSQTQPSFKSVSGYIYDSSQIRMTAVSDIFTRPGGYDIYHYYVG